MPKGNNIALDGQPESTERLDLMQSFNCGIFVFCGKKNFSQRHKARKGKLLSRPLCRP